MKYTARPRFSISVIFAAMLMFAGLLAGCGSSEPDPTPTPEPVLADCFKYFHIMAWHDLNGDGLRDDSEPRFEGVEFTVAGPYAHSTVGGRGVTNADGLVTIDTWAPGACLGDYQINATLPEGYAASTDLPVIVGEDAIASYELEFGFVPASNQ